MEQDRFQRIKQLFLAARELSADESRTWLQEHCDDPNLRADVERLLADQLQDSGVMETPAVELAGLSCAEPERLIGEQVGPYRIESVLGQGGMGVVYGARQQQPDRPVALKLIRGVVDPERARRLELEAQALALLRHPGIVPLYEQGRTPDGTPWIAMELVNGIPLDRFVRRHDVSPKNRLRLFLELCDAIAHAHLKGIIHRDLKPANVLVSESREASAYKSSGSRIGAVRVLDFGLARFTGVDLTLGASLTNPGQAVGTVMYMSPEQARSEEIDQRTDVYALSVILYELLTEGRPFDLEGLWVVEAIRQVVSTDPRPPTELSPELDQDLVTILMKGLAKPPEQRYQSVAALSGDVERYLDKLPILAHRPSTLYHLRKLAQRHRIFSVCVVVLLISFVLAGSTFAWMQSRHVERLSRERDRARSVVAFQSRLFAAEGVGGDPAVKVASLLDAASRQLDQAFPRQPLVAAEVRHTVGATYQALGLYREAEPQLIRALESRRERLGADHLATLETRGRLAELLLELGRFQDARTAVEELLEDRRRVQGRRHLATLATQVDLGTALRFNSMLDRAAWEYRDALEGLAQDHAGERVLFLRASSELAAALRLLGEPAESERLLLDLLPEMRSLLGEESPITNQACSLLGLALRSQGKLEAALELQRDLLGTRLELLGEEHPLTLTAQNNLSSLLLGLGRFEEAEALLRKLLEVKRRVLGSEHQSTVTSLMNLAVLLGQTGRMPEALPLMEEVVELDRKIFGPEHYSTLTARLNLAHTLVSVGRREEGLELNREVAEDFERTLGLEHPETIGAYSNLGAQLQQLGRLEESVEVLRRAHGPCVEQRGIEDSETQFLQLNLAGALRKLQRPEEAEPLYQELLELPDGALSPESGLPFLVRGGYARCLVDLERPEAAEPLIVEAIEGISALYGPRHGRTLDLIQTAILIYQGLDRESDLARYRELLRPPKAESSND